MLFSQQQRLLLGGHMCVDLCSGNRAMAKQGLNVAYIHSGLQQRRGKRMAKHMGRYMIRRTDSVQVFVDNTPDCLRGKRMPPSVK